MSYKGKRNKKKEAQVNKKKKAFNLKLWFAALLAVIITLVLYIPSLNNAFTNWDDPTYVTENPIVRDLKTENLKAIFTKPVSLNYHPLTMLSLAFDAKNAKVKGKIDKQNLLAPLNPKPFHITNLLLHLLNTLLVFFFIYFLIGKKIIPAFIVALFFGIHPMHVESVAWIAERKDVLYTFFYITALIVYLKYLEKLKLKFLFLAFIFFILSSFSKAVAVTLPVVFYAIDFYKGRKFDKRAILEKIPFLIISIIVGIAAIKIQAGGALAKDGVITYFQKFIFASYGFTMYIYKLIVPLNLSTFYPYPNLLTNGNLPGMYYAMPFIAAGIGGLAIISLKKTKAIFFGMIFFLITVALVLQLITVGNAIMADRYSYIPYIGLLFIIAYYFNKLWDSKAKPAKFMRYLAALALLAFAIWFFVLSRKQIKVWKNSETLWTQVINNYPRADVAYKNRGNYYGNLKLIDKAMKDYQVLIDRGSKDKQIWGNIGNIYRMRNEYDKAFEAYNKQVELTPNDYKAYLNRAIIYGLLKKYDKSIEDFDHAGKLGCPPVSIAQNRAYSYLYGGQYENAISDFNILIKRNPYETSYYKNRGLAKYYLNKFEEAISDFKAALKSGNDKGSLYYNISVCYFKLGDKLNAKANAEKAVANGHQVTSSYMNGLK